MKKTKNTFKSETSFSLAVVVTGLNVTMYDNLKYPVMPPAFSFLAHNCAVVADTGCLSALACDRCVQAELAYLSWSNLLSFFPYILFSTASDTICFKIISIQNTTRGRREGHVSLPGQRLVFDNLLSGQISNPLNHEAAELKPGTFRILWGGATWTSGDVCKPGDQHRTSDMCAWQQGVPTKSDDLFEDSRLFSTQTNTI